MRVFKKVLKYIFIIFTSLVLGINLYSINAKLVGSNPLPMPFGYGTAIVMSGSMEPTLHVGDLVIVKQAGVDELSEGDIAVYLSGDTLIIHRIVYMLDDGNAGKTVVFKGDANNVADDPISGTRVLGKYAGSVQFLGSVLLGIRNPISMIVLIIATILLIKILDTGETSKEQKERKEEKEKLQEEIQKLRVEILNEATKKRE